jgi:ribonucleoside-diphosphate reductase alpha chain
VIDKYLVQDRSNGQVFETPQMMYMLIAATIFKNYKNGKRMTYVKKYYDAISKFKINIPTRLWQVLEHLFGSMLVACWLMLMILLPSIFSSDMAIGNYVAQRAGIGINAGRIQRNQFQN